MVRVHLFYIPLKLFTPQSHSLSLSARAFLFLAKYSAKSEFELINKRLMPFATFLRTPGIAAVPV